MVWGRFRPESRGVIYTCVIFLLAVSAAGSWDLIKSIAGTGLCMFQSASDEFQRIDMQGSRHLAPLCETVLWEFVAILARYQTDVGSMSKSSSPVGADDLDIKLRSSRCRANLATNSRPKPGRTRPGRRHSGGPGADVPWPGLGV